MGRTDGEHLTPGSASPRDSEDDLGSRTGTLNNEGSVRMDQFPERDGFLTPEAFKLEFNDHMTRLPQKGFLLGLEKSGLKDFQRGL